LPPRCPTQQKSWRSPWSVCLSVCLSVCQMECQSVYVCVCVCVATLVLVSSGHVDTGDWSVSDDVMGDDGAQFVPVFQQTPRNVSVSLGDRAVLRCRVENLGTRTVRQLLYYYNSCVFQDLTGCGCSLLTSRSFTYPSKTDLV